MGEKKKGLELMDLFFKYFPYQKFSIDMDDAIFANLYYKAGDVERGNKIVNIIAKIYTENLEYYYSFTGNFADAYKEDIQNALVMIHSLQMLASQNNQDKVAKQMENLFNMEAGKFKQ